MRVTVGSWSGETVAIRKLARMVAALPPHRFIPLNAALDRAKDCLGSHRLAARDLTQRAHARRLTVAVRVIWPDGTEQSFILRPVFWQWYDIEDGPLFWESPPSERAARVYGPVRFYGNWHFFVGRKRFDRLYSVNQPVVREPQPPQQVAASGRSKSPKAPPDTAKKFVPYAVDRWPRWKNEGAGEYVNRLLMHAPKPWSRHTIQNLLSMLKKDPKRK
ncbi:MAG TPA: hypothetical protein VKJ47_13985 [Candidatus Binatia bacterium]|nr:hypothetical protein [Candidatus Binatia bacterium]